MTRRLLGAPVLLLALAGPAAAQEQIWIRQIGTANADLVFALAPDENGGVLLAGYTSDSFGGPNAGGVDAWLARMDRDGNLLWVRQLGTAGFDEARAVASDGAGGAFVAGATTGTLAGTSAGGQDAWIARYDSAGERLWIRQLGTWASDYAQALAPDGAGGAIVTGMWGGGGWTWGGGDVWCARYNAQGNAVWLKQFGGPIDTDRVSAAAADGAGSVYLAGWTGGIFMPPFSAAIGVWVGRLNIVTGSWVWGHQFHSGFAADDATAVAPDGVGGAFVAGWTTGVFTVPFGGGRDPWIARYDAAGNRVWIYQPGTPSSDSVNAMIPDGNGGVFVAGDTLGELGAPNAGNADIWLARYSGEGHLLWIRQFGTSFPETPRALAPDGAGGFFVAGDAYTALGGPHVGGTDVWVARWRGSPPLCYPDCNGDGALNLADFGCFQSRFALQHPYADCNGDLALNLADFGCFQTRFALGCP